MPTTREMPKYQCHKVVWALKIKAIEPSGCSATWLIPEEEGFAAIEATQEYMRRHNPEVGGYYVRYKDGYESYSPAEAFEEGYTRI